MVYKLSGIRMEIIKILFWRQKHVYCVLDGRFNINYKFLLKLLVLVELN